MFSLQRDRFVRFSLFLTVVFGALLLRLPLSSQESSRRILGTITDSSGAVMPGVTVSVTDTERGVTRALVTDAAGAYDAPNLTPGTYKVPVEAPGFKVLERQNIALGVGAEVRVDLTPQPGEQQQTVLVTWAAARDHQRHAGRHYEQQGHQ